MEMSLTQTDLVDFKQAHGMKWVATIFNIFPVWTIDPDTSVIENTCRAYFERTFRPDQHISSMEVTFLDQGSLNRVYFVHTVVAQRMTPVIQRISGITKVEETRKVVMRVSLPVDPHLKGASEIATMDFVRRFTKIPVVSVLDSALSATNPIQFDWMLQAYSLGSSVFRSWNALGYSGREQLTAQLAELQLDLFTKARFAKVGNIYLTNSHKTEAGTTTKHEMAGAGYEIGKIVSTPFIIKNASIEVPNRGPFPNTAAWLGAQLNNLLLECDRLEQSSDEDDIGFAETSRWLAERLALLMPNFFPLIIPENEETVLVHEDLHENNIFCDKDGNILSIIDWEATSCLPLWTVYNLPKSLQGRTDHKEPLAEEYEDDDDGRDTLFRKHLQDYQRTKLREVYLDTMKRIWPDWVVQFQKTENKARRDLRKAIDYCDNVTMWQRIEPWLDRVEKLERWGDYVPLDLS